MAMWGTFDQLYSFFDILASTFGPEPYDPGTYGPVPIGPSHYKSWRMF